MCCGTGVCADDWQPGHDHTPDGTRTISPACDRSSWVFATARKKFANRRPALNRTKRLRLALRSLSPAVVREHARDLLSTAAAGRIVLDLKDVTLVDRAAVHFLARVEMAGTELVNCPEYVRSWIAAQTEADDAASRRMSEE